MPRTTWAAGAMALGLMALAGCADNPMVLQGRVAQYQQQQSALQNQIELYQSRIDTLDHDNQHKEALLAQHQQQTKLLEDRLTAVTEQLRSTTAQLAQIQGEKHELDGKTQPSRPAFAARRAFPSRPTTASCKRCRRFVIPKSTSAATATSSASNCPATSFSILAGRGCGRRR